MSAQRKSHLNTLYKRAGGGLRKEIAAGRWSAYLRTWFSK